jgi:hypothetical protein
VQRDRAITPAARSLPASRRAALDTHQEVGEAAPPLGRRPHRAMPIPRGRARDACPARGSRRSAHGAAAVSTGVAGRYVRSGRSGRSGRSMPPRRPRRRRAACLSMGALQAGLGGFQRAGGCYRGKGERSRCQRRTMSYRPAMSCSSVLATYITRPSRGLTIRRWPPNPIATKPSKPARLSTHV